MNSGDVEVSWSEIKTFQRCPKQHEYKYVQKLVPRRKVRPLFMGNWFHKSIETHYKQGDWRVGYKEYLDEWNKLFEEERQELNTKAKGDIPIIIKRMVQSYLWYYKDDGWKVKYVEVKFRVPIHVKTRDGELVIVIKGIIDLIIEDDEGNLWVVDHKTASTIPEPNSFHAMDPQLMIYPWAFERSTDIQVMGIIYNYCKSKAPTQPQLTKTGAISRRKIVTDYPTLVRFLKANNQSLEDWAHILRPLRRRSPFLRRYRLPREPRVTREIIKDICDVAVHIATDERRPRSITRDCARMCQFHDLCRAELNGFDTDMMRKTDFTIKEDNVEELILEEPEDGDNGTDD